MTHPLDRAFLRKAARAIAKDVRIRDVRQAVTEVLQRHPLRYGCQWCGGEMPERKDNGAKPLTCSEDCRVARRDDERRLLRWARKDAQ